MQRLRVRDSATWLALAFVVVALAAVGLAAFLLAESQADQRRELRERYADRVEVATALIGSLLGVAYNGSREDAAERFSGTVTRRELDAFAERGNAEYLVVLDSAGRTIASSRGTPAGTADRLAARPPFVKHALTARAGYGLGELQPEGVIESAVAFPADGGVRMLVSAAPVRVFREFLSGALAPVPQGEEGRTWVFDRNGAVISSVNAPGGLKPAPELVQRSLRESEGFFVAPSTGQERYFAARSVPDTDLRIVAGVPEADLYMTASGGARWTPWFILAMGTLALIGVALLLRRLLRTRERLHVANADLEQSRVRLEERAAELERSNADLEQFAYAASHDLSEPLRTVAGFSQLLGARYRGKLDEEADEMIRYMGDGVDRMQQLIDDLLLYSRVGRAPLHEERVDLGDALREARAWLGPAAEERGAEITADPLPEVLGEQGQLAQVFQNLLANAIKFTAPDVTPVVHVAASSSGGEWRIAVADNGIGVDPAQADAIFKMFGRLHPVEEYPGTGIGLALVKRIVERHGGRIWVESGPAGGSVFVFTLPDRVRVSRPAAVPSSEAVA
ncbi:MAG TPA: ATP-binding protein [Solirubrobacteraceae bacterium]|nr:ATP-binding protein [Solirubrobacteraceae bacterium]